VPKKENQESGILEKKKTRKNGRKENDAKTSASETFRKKYLNI